MAETTQKSSDSKQLSPRTSELNALRQRGYTIGRKIGQGSYASVHIADYIDRSLRKERLACKIFDRSKAPNDFLEKFFPREIDVLCNIEHEFVVRVHSILQRGPKVFIFMMYAENGDLLDHIKRYGIVSESSAKSWFRQITSGLRYLHSKNIAHRDMKCENILLTRDFQVRIADFGFARYCANKSGRRVLSETYCGSAAYAAPEIVMGRAYNPKLADIWSVGIILYIMLNGTMPFNDENLKKLLKDQLNRNWTFRNRVKNIVTSPCKSLLRHILEPDIMLRYTLDRIAAHEWMRGHHHHHHTRPNTPGRMLDRDNSIVSNEDGDTTSKREGESTRAAARKASRLLNKTKSKQNVAESRGEKCIKE
ncbi:hypothetical protein LSTR_LSTR006753 [Laodelphax striatellus]|uniref:Protein kinase domain-containing protein n=1 Tax=Laodelphax striatellus TaxID=195883 RepID=A0A482XD78_LAOST|nr:hypothetical protein LSTR_LSTR006753 [Laodelphax striatellus]